MRVNSQFVMSNAVRQAQLRHSEIATLQDQLASGLRIRKPSDSPSDWNSLSGQKSAVELMDVDLQNISTVTHRLNQSVTILTEAGNMLVRAREIGLDGLQSQHRETLALEVDRLLEKMLSIANTEVGGTHIYSGTASHIKAFEISESDELGRPTAVQYLGSDHVSETIVGTDAFSPVLLSGESIFQQNDRTTTQYIGETGAQAGAGTDNARGVGQLIVRHTSTTYSDPQVTPGASSVDGDSILGPLGTHTLTIEDDPDLGRIARLNGGGPNPFDATATDLKVVGPEGAHVYVNLSGVAPAFTGDVQITSEGTLSVDGGVTEVPIDFSNNQVLPHTADGTVTVVDSTNIRRAGTDHIEYTGTNGVFDTLIQLRDDLRRADGLESEELVAIMDARLADLERAHGQILNIVGEQSVELSNLETLEDKTRQVRLSTQEAVNDLENADVTDLIVRLQTQQTHLQFIYASTAAMQQTNLLDFIS